jgi:hypothetical protein
MLAIDKAFSLIAFDVPGRYTYLGFPILCQLGILVILPLVVWV